MLEGSLFLMRMVQLMMSLDKIAVQTKVVVINTPLGDLSHQRDNQIKLYVRDWHYMRGYNG